MTRVIRLHAVANGHTLRFYGLDQRRRCVLGPLPPSLTRKQARAIRRAGELLKQIMPKKGANQNISAGADTKDLTRKQAGDDAGFLT